MAHAHCQGRGSGENVTGSWRRESSLTAELLPVLWGFMYEMRKSEVMLGAKCFGGVGAMVRGLASNLILSSCPCSFSKDQQYGRQWALASRDLPCSVHCLLPQQGWEAWTGIYPGIGTCPIPSSYPEPCWYSAAGTQQTSHLCEVDGSPLTWWASSLFFKWHLLGEVRALL